jgi:prepilin-type N-terminal cleavage/methylation domain-containing protein
MHLTSSGCQLDVSESAAGLKPVHGRNRCAFTLIEMLVVIAIIGILAALLLPVLSKAKVRAMIAEDVSNLHQFGLACTIYASDYNDWLPQGAYDISHIAANSYTNLLAEGLSSNALACVCVREYAGVAAWQPIGTGPTGNNPPWVYIGWDYWPGTQYPYVPPGYAQNFNVNDEIVYNRPTKMSAPLMTPSSHTLANCQHWIGLTPSVGASFIPHINGATGIVFPLGAQPQSGEGLASARLDGSTLWMKWSALASVTNNSNIYMYAPFSSMP